MYFPERKKEQRQASINLLLDFLEITDKIKGGISVGFIISLLYSISGCMAMFYSKNFKNNFIFNIKIIFENLKTCLVRNMN